MKSDFSQLQHMHPLLNQITLEIESYFGVEFTETSGFRPSDKGVHGYGRGRDLRCKVQEFGKIIEDFVNSRWIYDPTRPEMVCCMWHGDPKHIHLQVHPRTQLR